MDLDARIIAGIVAYALVAIGVLVYCVFMIGAMAVDLDVSYIVVLSVLSFIAAVLWPLPAVFISGCWLWRKARGIDGH